MDTYMYTDMANEMVHEEWYKDVPDLVGAPGHVPNESDPCDRACDDHFSIVCDQNGTRYYNFCHFLIARCKDPTLKTDRSACGVDANGHAIIPADPGPPLGMTPLTRVRTWYNLC
jgi:hypothetical protein